MIEWQWSSFEQLSATALYHVLAVRQDVFILEQQCLYADIDWFDQRAYHLLGWQKEMAGQRQLVAYLRGMGPGIKYEDATLGRVLTVNPVRATGIGKMLLSEGIRRIEQQFPGARIRISAQRHLEKFYQHQGFRTVSEPYEEDGIPHLEMLRISSK